MEMFFARHGKDDANYRGGWSENDLIPEGIEQAKRLANHIREHNQEYRIQKIISSDLPRAMTTARFISDESGLPVQQECRLREINNGDLAGMLNEEAARQYPGLFFGSLEMEESYPNGESPKAFFERIKNWFDDFIKNNNTDDNILFVTHGGVIRIIYHLVNEIEWNNQSRLYKADNCAIHVLNTETMKFEVENNDDFLTNPVVPGCKYDWENCKGTG